MLSAYAAQYRRLWTEHWWWQARRRYVLSLIARLAAQAEIRAILDIGCGDGLFFDDLRRFGDVWGIEPDARLVAPQNPWRSRIEVCAFGPEYTTERRFDLVVMLDVLEHIENDAGALRAVWRLLKTGGHAIFTVPALPLLWSVHDEANAHYRRYRREGLRRLLHETGFQVLEIRYYFGWTLLPMLLRRLVFPAGRRGACEYRARIPPRVINCLMRWMTLMEQAVTFPLGLPLGTSLYAVVRRPVGD